MATIAVGGTVYSSSINTGSLDGKSSKAYKLRCGMTLNSQSIINNTSTVTFFVQMCSYGSYGFNGFTSPKAYQSYSVNGGSYTSNSYTQVKKVSASETSWKTVHTMTKTITHDSAGKATVRARAYFDPHISSSNTTYYYVPAKTGYVYTDTYSLPDLHTPPVLSISSITEENSLLTADSLGFPNNIIVTNQSIKTFKYALTLYDNATVDTVTINGYNFTLYPTEAGDEYYTTVDFSKYAFAYANDSMTLTHAITDSMSGLASVQETYSVIPYIQPYFNASQTILKRDGQLTGKVKLTMAANFYNNSIFGTQGSIEPSIRIQYKYAVKSAVAAISEEWITIPEEDFTVAADGTISLTNYNLKDTEGNVITNVDKDNVYTFDIQLIDQFGETTTLTKEILRGQYLWAEFQDRVDFNKITLNGEIVPATEIGDVKITSTNVGLDAMAARYGGTWELIDKDFTPASGDNGMTVYGTNASGGHLSWSRSGHVISFNMGFTANTNFADDELKIGTVNMAVLGLSNVPFDQIEFVTWTDAGQSVLFTRFARTGAGTEASPFGAAIYGVDQIPDNYIASGRWLEGSFSMVCRTSDMLDSACNKFYWQRIS